MSLRYVSAPSAVTRPHARHAARWLGDAERSSNS